MKVFEGCWKFICMDDTEDNVTTTLKLPPLEAGMYSQNALVPRPSLMQQQGVLYLQDYNTSAAPVSELVERIMEDIRTLETNFTITRLSLLGKGAAGTVQLCKCRDANGYESVIALKELATPEIWEPPSKKRSTEEFNQSLQTALQALPLTEAAFQRVLTHESIVDIQWADITVTDALTKQPIPVKWKNRGARVASMRRNTTISGRSYDASNGSSTDPSHAADPPFVTLKLLLKAGPDLDALPKAIGFNMRIAMEYCELGALSEHLITRHNDRAIPINVIADNMDGTLCAALTALDIAGGLKLLHKNQIVHGDVKPHNILLSRRGVNRSEHDPRGFAAKLSDFGMSVLQSAGHEAKQGSVEYMPHENFRECKVTYATDVYALGIVMWEMWHNQLWEEVYRKELNKQRFGIIDMSNFRPVCNASCPAGYRDIVEACLSPDSQRPTMTKLVKMLQRLQDELCNRRTVTNVQHGRMPYN